ncbi:MAG: hypothetical protein RMJ14_04430 [Nitrososphaerota archaeon]|nr:hypothetical protein [Aigarchaeota archaeon]MDW8076865.1 hypothetical protein [Nitrososphaerota archaeon]
MQDSPDIVLMLALFVFLAAFYLCVVLFYAKIKAPKVTYNTSRYVPIGHTSNQAAHTTHENHYGTLKDEDRTVIQVVQAPHSAKTDSKLEPPSQSRQLKLTEEGNVAPKESTEEVEKIVELIEDSVKSVRMSKGAEEAQDEVADVSGSDYIETSDDRSRSYYQTFSEDFVKNLKDLKDAINELRRRIYATSRS